MPSGADSSERCPIPSEVFDVMAEEGLLPDWVDVSADDTAGCGVCIAEVFVQNGVPAFIFC